MTLNIHFVLLFSGATPRDDDTVIAVKQHPFSRRAQETVPGRDFWRTQFYLPRSQFVKFNFSIPDYSVMAVYLRRSAHPTHARYDYVHVLDGVALASTSVGGGGRERRALRSQVTAYTSIDVMSQQQL